MKMPQFLYIMSFWIVALLFGGNIQAQEIKVQAAEKDFVFKNSDGSELTSLEPSAIEAINDKYLLVADDKTANLFVVEAATGKVVKILTIPEFSVGKPKWEALAFDGEFFYLIGSHAVKLDDTLEKLTKKLAARSHLLRFKLKNAGGDASAIEIDSPIELDAADSLKTAGLYNSDPNKNKVKIEGLAVRPKPDKKKELIFAMREPSDFMHVFSAELPIAPKSGDKLSLKPFFSFEAGKISTTAFRLSSIEYVPQWNGFFMLTSTEDANTNAFFGNAIWFVSDEILKTSSPSKQIVPQIIYLFAVDMKAEGLCILPDVTNDKLHLALVFDNDFEDTKTAGKMRIIEVSKK